MIKFSSYKFINWFGFILSSFLFCWILNRTYNLQITNDEAYSFFLVDSFKIKYLLGTANTHWLNSFFIFFETKIIGREPWMFRIHSTLSFIVFSFFLTKIVSSFSNKIISISALISILCNRYIIDFFSLARGYSLGLTYEMAALYFILNKKRNFKSRFIIYILLILAAFSVYTHIYFLLGYIVFDVVLFYKENDFNSFFKKESIKLYIVPTLFFFIAIPNLIFIKISGDLNEGQTNGFVDDTIGVFIQRSFIHLFSLNISVIISFCIAIIILAISIFMLVKKKLNSTISLACILFLIVIISELFFYFLKIPFSFGRTSFYFCMPLLVLFFNLLDELNFIIISIPISLLCLTFTSYNFIKFNDANITLEWDRNQGMKNVLYELKQIEKNNLSATTLGLSLNHIGVLNNYYKYLDNSLTFDNVVVYTPTAGQQIDSAMLEKLKNQKYVLWFNNINYQNNNAVILDSFKEMNTLLIKNY